MNISIVAVGKVKEKYIKDGIKEFEKRLQRFCRLNIIEVADEKVTESMSDAEKDQLRMKEGEKILRHIRSDHYVIALAIEGEQLSSQELANHLQQLATYGKGKIVFIIGGSIGLSEHTLDRANVILSFSKFTFPHQLMRLILSEQLYRSFQILQGGAYHK